MKNLWFATLQHNITTIVVLVSVVCSCTESGCGVSSGCCSERTRKLLSLSQKGSCVYSDSLLEFPWVSRCNPTPAVKIFPTIATPHLRDAAPLFDLAERNSRGKYQLVYHILEKYTLPSNCYYAIPETGAASNLLAICHSTRSRQFICHLRVPHHFLRFIMTIKMIVYAELYE